MATIQKVGDELKISFNYSSEVVGVIKNIPGRRYSPQDKCWFVPLRFLPQARAELAAFGFEWSKELTDSLAIPKINAIKSDLPLYSYQKEGVLFLLNNERALLASDPGTGKSIQALVALQEAGCKKILWITLKSLCATAEKEILKWYPEKKIVVISNAKKGVSNRLIQYQGDYEFYILNYEKVRTDIEILRHFEWDAVVCDESIKISNHQAQVTKAVALLKAKRIILMSGSPMSNTPSDYYAQMNTLAPGLLGTWYQFINRYCSLDYFGHVESYKNLDHLKQVMSPYIIRHAKRDVLKELPERVVEDIVFELSKNERKIYDAVKKEILASISHMELSKVDWGTLNLVLTKLLRLQEICNSLLLVGETNESSKMSVLFEILETLPSNLLIFSRFSRMVDILESSLKEKRYKVLKLKGDMSTQARQRVVNEFNELENGFLCGTDAMAYGLNLQSASCMINFDLPFSIAKNEQRIGRIERIGQGEKMLIINLLAKNTVDEWTKSVLESKQKVAKEMLEDIKQMI